MYSLRVVVRVSWSCWSIQHRLAISKYQRQVYKVYKFLCLWEEVTESRQNWREIGGKGQGRQWVLSSGKFNTLSLFKVGREQDESSGMSH